MRPTSILALASAATLVIASPVNLAKKAYEYDFVTDTVWVTVTEGDYYPATADDSTVTIMSTVYVSPMYSSASPTTVVAPAAAVTDVVVAVPSTTSAAPAVVTPATSEAPVVETVPVVAAAASTPVAVQVSSSTAAAAASSPTDFDSTCTYHHNIHRSNHSAPAVTYNSEIAGYAQTLANRCSNSHDVTIGTADYGQNIASYGSSDAATLDEDTVMAAMITQMWYDGEVSFFDDLYGQASPTTDFESWGHFTQVVWKGTTEVGCAVTLCPAGTIFAGLSTWFGVCNYRTAGNVGGEYATNVLPPLGDTTVTVTL